MDGYFFVVISTYKPVHGEWSRVAVGRTDFDWVTTPQILALYIHAGLTLAVTLGPLPYSWCSCSSLPLELCWEVGRGEVRGGHVMGEDISTSHITRPLFQITSTISRLASFHSVLNPDWYRFGNEVTNKSVSNIHAAKMHCRLVFWIAVLGNPVREERQ